MSSGTVQILRIQTACLAVLATVATGAALYWLSPVLIPFVLAIFLTLCLRPVVDLLHRHLHLPRMVALVVAIVLGGVILALISSLVAASVGQMTENSDHYEEQFKQLLATLDDWLPLERLGIENASDSLLTLTGDAAGSVVTSSVGAIMSVLSNGLLVVIFMIFMMAGSSSTDAPEGGIRSEVQTSISRYVVTKVMVSGTTGILVGVTLSLLGVELALVFGVLTFLLNFIPNIGSFIATCLPLPVVLLSGDLSVTVKVLAIVIPGAIQFSMGNVVEPKMQGKSLDLHPVVVLIALIFFGMIWGIVGMFIATPITAVMKIVLERSPATAPLAEVLAGRLEGLAAYAASADADSSKPDG